MTQLLDLVTRILTGLSPLLLVATLLALAAWRDRRRLAETARQVRLTDALAEELGAIVASVVKKRLWGWRIAIRVPFGRPAVVARVLAVVKGTLGDPRSERYEIVLSPQEPAPASWRRVGGRPSGDSEPCENLWSEITPISAGGSRRSPRMGEESGKPTGSWSSPVAHETGDRPLRPTPFRYHGEGPEVT